MLILPEWPSFPKTKGFDADKLLATRAVIRSMMTELDNMDGGSQEALFEALEASEHCISLMLTDRGFD